MYGTEADPLQPVYTQPTTSDYNVSPGQSLSQLQNAYALQNAQAQNNFSNLAASQGISGGDLLTGENTLQGQLAASEAPTLASLIQNAQQMGLGQSEFNAGAYNQAGEFNANAANSAGNSLAQMLMQNYGLTESEIAGILGAGQGASNSAAGSAGQWENESTNQNWGNFMNALMLFGGM